MLPMLQALLSSDHDEYVLAALDALQLLLESFGTIIAETCNARHVGVGVDLSAETRAERCKACSELFDSMRPQLKQLEQHGSKRKLDLSTPAAVLLRNIVARLRIVAL